MEDVLELLSQYQAFITEGKRGDFAAFGAWLRQQKTSTKPPEVAVEFEQVAAGSSSVQATFFFGRLTRYLDYWLKLTFQETPLTSIGDYAILKEVQYLGQPTKTTIFERQVMERTTCMEAIKRLIRHGLLAESVDPEDRRRRRVKLTPTGDALIPKLDEKMTNLAGMLFGELSEAERQNIIPSLKKMMDFHDRLYQEKEKDEIKRAFDL